MSRLKLSAVHALAKGVEFRVVIKAPLERVLKKLQEYGYDGIEYNISNPYEVDVVELKRKTRNHGLGVAAISTGLSYLRYGYSLSSRDEHERNMAIKFFKKYIEIAEKLEAYKVVIGLARGRCKGDCSDALRRLEESLKILDNYAGEHSVILVFEPLNRYETDLINKLEDALNLISKYENVKILFDTFHMMLEEKNVYEAILRAGNTIGHFHVADSNRLAPGMGMLDWEKIIYRLLRTGYEGYISVESRIEPDLDTMLRVSAETLKPLLI